MSLADFWKSLTPIEEEQAKPQELAAATSVPAAQAAPVSAPVGIQEYDVAAAVAPLVEPRAANYRAPRIQIPESDDVSNKERELKFSSSLEKLQADYKLAQEDARSRQMKAEMMAAVGNNIGNIVAGAQAMNTKASVTAPQMHKIEVKDMVGRVDKNHKDSYEALLKQYKDLQDGGLTAKDRLYANIAQAQLDNSAERMNSNIENTDRNAGMRGIGMVKSAQEGDELSDKQTEADTDFQTAITSGNLIGDRAAEFAEDLGPIAARVEGVKRGVVGSILPVEANPKFTEFTADVERMGADYRKVISGLTVSDKEKESLNASIPQVTDRHSDFKAKQASFVKNLMRAKKISDDNIQTKQGKNVQGYGQPAASSSSSAPGGQETVERNGKTYKWNSSVGKYQLAQ